MKKLQKFSFQEVGNYVHYIGDSYLHARQQTPGSMVIEVMSNFREINKWLEKANELYSKSSSK